SALGRVGLPPFPSETAGGSWFKARWDRRWPKGDPEKQGGRFAPKDSEADSAGEIAGPGHNNPPSEIKAEPRPNRWITAHKIARRFARFGATLGGRLPSWGKVAAAIAALSPEIVDHVADIVSYYDEPKTFDELRITKDYREYQSFDALKRDLRPEGSPGYQLHHIVEQNPSNIERFGQGKIQSTENVVEIPTYAHEEISARYNSKNGDSGDMTVREWLSSKPYPFQKEYGLRILKEVGVLR
ncbi:MAG TPA: hypothetical protein VEZ90_19460, partial [Blastocatellia bacterium]|nr:hypothetical protein [Blastocatellia bacterium]